MPQHLAPHRSSTHLSKEGKEREAERISQVKVPPLQRKGRQEVG